MPTPDAWAVNRVALLIACVALTIAAWSPHASAQAPPPAGVEMLERIRAAATDNRQRLDFDGKQFSGLAWETLLGAGRDAQFFLLGEEHGIAQNAQLAAALFRELVPAGYSRVVIEVSPPMARILDETLRKGGLDALRELYARPGGEPAFFGMQEEALFIAAVRERVPGKQPVLWGVDYEVASDRPLLRRLASARVPRGARDALADLSAASDQCWRQFNEQRSPAFIFSFCGDPQAVRALRQVWPRPDAQSAWILDTLEETLEINRLWAEGRGWGSNARRGALMRTNFLRHWRAHKPTRRTPRVLAKLGASHLVRGLNTTETFDLGTLLPELAAIEGKTVFSLLVVAGRASLTAVLDPVTWTYRPKPAKDAYAAGLEPLVDAAYEDAFTLFDLRALRPLLPASKRRDVHSNLMRFVHGFDAVLVMSGSTPSGEFAHD